jgi:hypothetical protein
MKLEERDLSETEKTKISWMIVYLFVSLTLLSLMFHAWDLSHVQPFRWHDAIDVGLQFLICPFPLLMGIFFRGLLRKELKKNLLSARTYQICDYWIAQLLVYSYMVMLMISH